ncbi:hypothetical protein GCM10009554_17730 [Kribbella koreensis]|uniref:Uncharacterized protein n=1 Tax=Kribbella koreensis TaxID=57909 RepID=A0ABN1PTT2_9ACTN
MRIRRFALAVAGLSLAAGAVGAGQATAGVQGKPGPNFAAAGKAQAAGPCDVQVGAVDSTGQASANKIYATKPLSAGGPMDFKFFPIRASATWYYTGVNTPKSYYSAYVLQGSNLYLARANYEFGDATAPTAKRVGTGWAGFSTIATSNVLGSKGHKFLYGLHANGSLYRYNVTTGAVKSYGSAPGYAGFKAITVISETAGYDTLLASTKAGALWTIHIPVTAPFKATLKLVRSTGFKAYDYLVAQRCGSSSTMLAGLSKTSQVATAYAVSHANGTKTVINPLGTIELHSKASSVRLLRTGSDGPQLLGE